jgi:hypothetical protein
LSEGVIYLPHHLDAEDIHRGPRKGYAGNAVVELEFYVLIVVGHLDTPIHFAGGAPSHD